MREGDAVKVRATRKSRIRRAVFALVGIAALATAAVAQAQLRFINDVTITGGGVALFDPDNAYDGGNDCGPDQGYTPVSDGQYGGTSDSDSSYKADDAFDGGLIISVNGKRYHDPDNLGNWRNHSLRTSDEVAGFDVTRIDGGLSHTATMRNLVALTNPSGGNKNAKLTLSSNLGSDSGTFVRRSSANPQHELTKADRWVVTTDSTTDPTGDPPVTHVFSGPSAPGIDKVVEAPGPTECIVVNFNVNVPAHATRYVMWFVELHAPVKQEAAFHAAQKFNNPRQHPGLTQNLPDKLLHRVVNWDL